MFTFVFNQSFSIWIFFSFFWSRQGVTVLLSVARVIQCFSVIRVSSAFLEMSHTLEMRLFWLSLCVLSIPSPNSLEQALWIGLIVKEKKITEVEHNLLAGAIDDNLMHIPFSSSLCHRVPLCRVAISLRYINSHLGALYCLPSYINYYPPM